MVNSFWRLTIVTEHSALNLLGSEDVLRASMSEWREHFTKGFDNNKVMMAVEGLCDSADRAECSTLIPMANIDSMTLVKM